MASPAIVKRGFDLIVAASALAFTAPVMFGAALAVRVSLGKPVLFRQLRPGLGGKPFTLYKFRSMRAPRPGQGELASDAERLSRLGAFLRQTSIDELPTLWNVLRGEMSIVGPRPLLMQYLSRYTPQQARRHEVKPGITGWAQINGRNALSWEAKFEHDVWYVDHQSLLLDLEIVLRTLSGVLRRRGISAEGHVSMPEFMGSEAAPNRVEADE